MYSHIFYVISFGSFAWFNILLMIKNDLTIVEFMVTPVTSYPSTFLSFRGQLYLTFGTESIFWALFWPFSSIQAPMNGKEWLHEEMLRRDVFMTITWTDIWNDYCMLIKNYLTGTESPPIGGI